MLNRFESQKFIEEKVLDQNGKVIGVIRIKPSGVMWKPKGKGKFLAVGLDTFIKWITDPATNAKPTNQ